MINTHYEVKRSLRSRQKLLTLLILWTLVTSSRSHGRLVDPPSRGTMWRLGFHTPPDYNDHELFCGGFEVSTNKQNKQSLFPIELAFFDEGKTKKREREREREIGRKKREREKEKEIGRKKEGERERNREKERQRGSEAERKEQTQSFASESLGTPVKRTCQAHLSSTPVKHTCQAHLSGTSVRFPCQVYPSCAPVRYNYRVHLSDVPVRCTWVDGDTCVAMLNVKHVHASRALPCSTYTEYTDLCDHTEDAVLRHAVCGSGRRTGGAVGSVGTPGISPGLDPTRLGGNSELEPWGRSTGLGRWVCMVYCKGQVGLHGML
ncbi:hypothetical protein FHG87_011648 [Trinorchestia longiramus]|nr:hypothetical protein FHG87_011648 [Trinorchestia longiramus]